MNGYLANPKATAETMDGEGWFHTGDVGHVDTHGNLYITDRLKVSFGDTVTGAYEPVL